VPDAIEACSKQPWQSTKVEKEHEAALNERRLAQREREMELRKTARTSAEIQEGVRRVYAKIEDVFDKHKIKSSGKIVVTLTVSPTGEVTEAHVVSSEFVDPGLEEAVLGIVRTMRYEPRDVPAHTEPGVAIRFDYR
jgi:TonB family protein